MTYTELEKLLAGRKSARLVYRRDTGEVLGLFYEWRKENPDELVMVQSNYGTFEMGTVFTDYKHYKETRKELGLEALHNKMIADYNAEQGKKRDAASKKAEPILDACEADLNAVLNRHGCALSYTIEPDEDYQYVSVEIDGFNFERKI
jgi:hypothetical protein